MRKIDTERSSQPEPMSHLRDLVHADAPGGFIEVTIARLRQRLAQTERSVAAAPPAMELHASET
jgi:hypothetical protein